MIGGLMGWVDRFEKAGCWGVDGRGELIVEKL